MEPVLLTLLIVVLVATVVVVWISGPKDMEKQKGTLEGVLMCFAGLGLLVLFVQRRKVDNTLPAALFFAGIFFCLLLVLGGAYVIISTRVNDLKISLPKTTQNIIASALAVVPAALLASTRVNWGVWDGDNNQQKLMLENYTYFSEGLVQSNLANDMQLFRAVGQYHFFEPYKSIVFQEDESTKQRKLFDQNIEELRKEFQKIGVNSEYTVFFGLTKDVKKFIECILSEYGCNTTQKLYALYGGVFHRDFNPKLGDNSLILGLSERQHEMMHAISHTTDQQDSVLINVEEKRFYDVLLESTKLHFGDFHVKMVVSFPNNVITTWQKQINSRLQATSTEITGLQSTEVYKQHITETIERELDETEINILLDLWNNAELYNTIVAQIRAHIKQQLSDVSKQAFYLKCDATTFKFNMKLGKYLEKKSREFTAIYTPVPGLNQIHTELMTFRWREEGESVQGVTTEAAVEGPVVEGEGESVQGVTTEAAVEGPVVEGEGESVQGVTTEPAEPAEEDDDDDAGKGTGSPAYTTSL
jgi:hypothetical protein